MARSRYVVLSAQQVDPLSWFTGPYLPLALSGLIFVSGAVITATSWSTSEHPWLQLAGLLLNVIAALLIHVRTRPLQRPIGWGTGTLALATSILGLVLSALDYRGTELNLNLWWGPAAPAIILLCLSPYLPARTMWVLGSATTIVTVGASMAILYPVNDYVGPVMTAVMIGFPVVMATAASTLFAYSLVSTMLPMLESPSRIMVVGQQARDEAVAELEHKTVARLIGRARPFLESVADAGRVTPEDRALAGQLARRLRDDLITQASESWLDSIASTSRLVVVDPDRLARLMTNAQRTAVLAMLRAILESPEADSDSLMIELRRAPDGSTAAAISMDLALPEGRRIMHFAPYYLTLKTAVDDLEFDRDRLTFRIPPRN
ncbi:hypothetical protein [Antiquaquibacter soli]|uniref:Uncharacterized protein n=1 Tax=Antiquaquibacter soli TaxID=3064523 RepID=A0ABT9BJT0_9MICO|nr:hypothetical protein [Protaetiibacter sp. WY-16]MDO7881278.1 hypothetical protein [Protaetiibacter sp. WY-16]